SGFAGTKQAPVNGLIVEGNVGIATDNPAEQLSVEGTILAKEIIGKATDGSAGIGIKGIGGNIGIQSYGSDIGIDVMATQTGVKVTSTGSKGISVVIKNASDAHQGIYTELKKPDGTLVVSGGLGKLASDYAASIYGAAPDVAGSSTNWAGLFDGPIKVSGNLGIGLLPSETPEATLHVKGSALIENQVYRSAPNIASSTTINWSINNKHSFNCSSGSNQNLTFQDPKLNGNYVDASFLLTLVVTNSNADCSVTFSGSTIKWEKGESPASGDTKGNGKVFLFHFFAQTTKSPGNATYYAYEPSEFSL
ncbi:MAG: hypothetical protein VW397_08780, partial [Candidatus Margulisiibacteriota bacterium]